MNTPRLHWQAAPPPPLQRFTLPGWHSGAAKPTFKYDHMFQLPTYAAGMLAPAGLHWNDEEYVARGACFACGAASSGLRREKPTERHCLPEPRKVGPAGTSE